MDPEIVESRIKSIEDKWKAEVDKLENERVSFLLDFLNNLNLIFLGSISKPN